MEQTLGSSSQDVLAEPVQGGYNLSTAARKAIDLSSSIKGWGSDLDPVRRPGVPRDKAPDIGGESLYPAGIEQQVAHVKIHKSTEHARLTPVFGTSCPPRGLSGWLRDFSYTFSEGRLTRWMTLMLADRVNVVEDVIGDLTRLRVPNVASEMGLGSELRFNRPRVVRNAAIAGVCMVGLVLYLRSRRD